MSFADFVERFLKDYASRRRSDHYEQNLAPAVEYFGACPLREVRPVDLDRFAAWRGRRVGPSTLRKNLTALGTAFKMAVRWGLLEVSPALDLDKPPEPTHKTRWLSEAEWRSLLETAPTWLKPLLRFALAQGLRLKEVTNLRWEDVDFQRGLLYVSRDSKTGRADVVPLTAEGNAVLQEQVAYRREIARATGRLPVFVFLDSSGEPYDSERKRNRISQWTRWAMRRAGIEGASFHTLRHTCASWMVQRGVSLAQVREFLRHRSIQTTLRYAHLEPQHLKDAVEALNATLATCSQGHARSAKQREGRVGVAGHATKCPPNGLRRGGEHWICADG